MLQKGGLAKFFLGHFAHLGVLPSLRLCAVEVEPWGSGDEESGAHSAEQVGYDFGSFGNKKVLLKAVFLHFQ